MIELEDAIRSLTALGWSEYESKTYSALVQQGKSTASQIAKKSQVPANRVYQILEKLTGKGHVKRISATMGGPSVYVAVNPQDVLDRDQNEHIKRITVAKNALSELQERETDIDFPVTYTIFGRPELNVYLRDIIDNANEEILLAVDTLLEIRHGGFAELLLQKKDDCDIKILTTPRGVNDAYEKEVLKMLEKIDILVTEDSFSTILIVVDSTSILFCSYAYPSYSEDATRGHFGVHLEDKKTAKMFVKMFNDSWSSAISPE